MSSIVHHGLRLDLSSALSASAIFQTGLTGPPFHARDGGTKVVLEPVVKNVLLSRVFTMLKQDSLTPRLVVDLTCLIRFTKSFQFHMPIITHVHLALQSGAWFITLGLGNTYWHIPINLRYRLFLVI